MKRTLREHINAEYRGKVKMFCAFHGYTPYHVNHLLRKGESFVIDDVIYSLLKAEHVVTEDGVLVRARGN